MSLDARAYAGVWPWEPLVPRDVGGLLEGIASPWWITGGCGIDLSGLGAGRVAPEVDAALAGLAPAPGTRRPARGLALRGEPVRARPATWVAGQTVAERRRAGVRRRARAPAVFPGRSRESPPVAIESGLASGQALLHGRRGAALAAALLAPDGAELEADERAAVALLGAARLLVDSAEDDDPALVAWEWHDLLFHRETRGWSDGRPRGRTYRLRGAVDPLPDAPPPHEGEAIALERPDLAALAASDLPLTDAIERRRSVRRFDESHPITRTELGRLLYGSAARRQRYEGGGIERSRRPAPSGGALAALELYVRVRACQGVEPGLYHYEADTHVLRDLRRRTSATFAFEGRGRAQVVLLIALRHARIAWAYERIAYQLALLDLGVLYQTLWLTATAIGLGGYPLGSVEADRFVRETGLDPLRGPGIGAFLLGRPAPGLVARTARPGRPGQAVPRGIASARPRTKESA